MAKLNLVAAELHSQRTRTNALIYGAPKSGKSEAISKLSKYFNLIWCDLENGWEVLLKLPPEQQAKVELLKLPDTRGMPIGIETVMKLVRGGKVFVCEEHGKADPAGCPICKKDNKPMVQIELAATDAQTIFVVDSGSALTMSAMARTCLGKPEDYKMIQDDWGNLGKWLDNVFSYVQAARFHSIFTAHEAEIEMDDGKVKLCPSIGTRNYARNCAKFFSHVVHLEVKNRGHLAASSTTYANNVLTGSRTNVCLESMKTEYQLLELFLPYLEGAEKAAAQAEIEAAKKAAQPEGVKK